MKSHSKHIHVTLPMENNIFHTNVAENEIFPMWAPFFGIVLIMRLFAICYYYNMLSCLLCAVAFMALFTFLALVHVLV